MEFTTKRLDLSKSRTYSARERHNLVTIADLVRPGSPGVYENRELDAVAQRVLEARRKGRPVLLFMGAHVVKCGLSPIIIDLIERGFVTHVAGNGATSIHDFELACLGGTSEHVPTAIEDGSFGMWEETGRYMNEAVISGYRDGLGYGGSLARYVYEHPQLFPFRKDCIFYRAYRAGVPATYHIGIGNDIIHEHPKADFAALGGASGYDFAAFCHSVAQLDEGVYLNVGSAVTGAEVFLKALAIARNQGYPVRRLTTANFDLLPLGDYHKPVGKDDPQYCYRPRRYGVNRPASLGGQGSHVPGDLLGTIPGLWSRLVGEN